MIHFISSYPVIQEFFFILWLDQQFSRSIKDFFYFTVIVYQQSFRYAEELFQESIRNFCFSGFASSPWNVRNFFFFWKTWQFCKLWAKSSIFFEQTFDFLRSESSLLKYKNVFFKKFYFSNIRKAFFEKT